MTIRPAVQADLPTISGIYEHARQFMRDTGNPHQWRDTNPTSAQTQQDLTDKCLYLAIDEDGVQGVFALIAGEDATYQQIDGAWLNDNPYATIHRVASAGNKHGILAACIAYATKQYADLRIDTHADNHIMQHLLARHGFTRCGIIRLANGEPRIAYHRTGTR